MGYFILFFFFCHRAVLGIWDTWAGLFFGNFADTKGGYILRLSKVLDLLKKQQKNKDIFGISLGFHFCLSWSWGLEVKMECWW